MFVQFGRSVSQSFSTSQPWSASCVCVQQICQPRPLPVPKSASKKLRDLPIPPSRMGMIAVQTCQPSVGSKVLQLLGIGLTWTKSKCCPALHYHTRTLHKSSPRFRPGCSSFSILHSTPCQASSRQTSCMTTCFQSVLTSHTTW